MYGFMNFNVCKNRMHFKKCTNSKFALAMENNSSRNLQNAYKFQSAVTQVKKKSAGMLHYSLASKPLHLHDGKSLCGSKYLTAWAKERAVEYEKDIQTR